MNQNNSRAEFATQLSKSVRYSSGRGQYDAFPDCQDAYIDGVETAIAMMYIDLTGGHKSEGMLEKFLHQELQKARHDWLREEIVKLEWMKRDCCAGIGPCDEICRATNEGNHTIQTIIDRYLSELDQPTDCTCDGFDTCYKHSEELDQHNKQQL